MDLTQPENPQVVSTLQILEKRLTTLEDVLTLLTDQNEDANIKRFRSSSLYRGLPNASYRLETSLRRNCKEKQEKCEGPILRNFAKYGMSEDPQIGDSVWRQLVLGQHHGLPTRLMDWTYSPLVALHFALSGENMDCMNDHDCVVWKIDIDEIHSLLPEIYQEILTREDAHLFTVDMLDQITNRLAIYDEIMGDHALVLLEPPSIDQRIINQYSYFSVMPNGIHDMEDFLKKYTKKSAKYVIAKDLRWRIRDMLDQMNINERTMYPGLDGLTAWIKRHYYVKAHEQE